MRIRVRSKDHGFSLILPTRMLFSKGLIKFGLRIGRKYSDQVPPLAPEAIDALCDEIKRIKRKHGSWKLVEVQSADGDDVRIIL